MIHVVYHKHCDDGFGAALAAWGYFREQSLTATFYAANYDDAPPVVADWDQVYILDFSYSRAVVERLAETCQVTLLDHHVSAARQWGLGPDHVRLQHALPNDGKVLFDMAHSGAVLAWRHFHHREPPLFYQYLEARDLWQKNRFSGVDEFTHALRSYPREFEVWQALVARWNVKELIEDGHIIKRYYDQQLRELMTNEHHATLTLDYVHPELKHMVKASGLAYNASKLFHSELGHELAKRSGTFGAVWTTSHDTAYISLRSDTTECNVSYIAQQFGGGGHAKAAGFSLPVASFYEHLHE